MNSSDINDSIRKKAEEIMDQVIDIDAGSASMLFRLIKQALLEMYSVGKDDGEQAGFERGVKDAGEVISPDGVIPCRSYEVPCGECFDCKRWKVKLRVLTLLQKDK